MSDHVDRVLAQWAEQVPGLDTSSMGVFGRVKRLARIIEAEQRAAFGAHDLDAAAFDVLATLRRSPAPHRLTPADLMRSAMVTSGAITQRLDRLEARELVVRTRREGDGRSVYVSLTEAGRELIDRALVDHVDNQNRLLSGLTDDQRERVADDLRGLLESLGDTDRHARRS
ncbi:MarR family winged helix-turn-helix transcriptional regulator [Streptomyces halstedii]|uniref:MarR family winged helix-turn-helix transcriptional regulator n=1 Tax=Streptomyces TaxID=1883 RepID=UPI0004A9744D|nr:MarR family transcriptional regulator [Streptomyces sp. NTK 937]KDQ68651.1 MarR family transcriptional regulator [Streptomyces sp. NTK 937]WSX36857.1 MarR family transcriptional regulator [Streptomyces halstedii]